MKNKIYLFLLLAIAGCSIHAQDGWILTASLSGDIKKTIIREYNSTQSIIYIETNRNCYFAWSDNSATLEPVCITCDYRVNDFEIYNDTVCFCGSVFDGYQYGLVGWFCIPDLLAGTDDFHVFYNRFNAIGQNSVLPNSYVEEFNDLTFFTGERNEHKEVALVGRTDKQESCVVRLNGVFQTNTWSYTSGASDINAGVLTQVVETSYHIVTGGFEPANQESTVHRVFLKHAMFTSPIGDTLYKYTRFTENSPCTVYCDYPVGNFKMTTMFDDYVATTSLYLDDTTVYPKIKGFVTHVIDVPSLYMTDVGAPCYDNALMKVQNDVSCGRINSLTYSIPYNMLAGLVGSKIPSTGNQTVMGEMPVPITTPIDYSYVNDYYFHDHDNYFSQTGWIASGSNKRNLSELAIYEQHLTTPGIMCRKKGTVSNEKACFFKKRDYYPLRVYTNTFTFTPIQHLGIQTIMLNIHCTEDKNIQNQ